MYLKSNKEINRLITKEVSSIYLNSSYWGKQSFLKPWFSESTNLSPDQFWPASTYAEIIEFQNFLLQLKKQNSGSKIVAGLFIISILKGIMKFESHRVHVFLNKKVNFKKTKRKKKSKILHTLLERRTLCYS